MPKVHFQNIRRRTTRQGGEITITGTLCDRMSNAGEEINSTEQRHDVTCKFCLRLLMAAKMGRAA